jgi:hypothetical protein
MLGDERAVWISISDIGGKGAINFMCFSIQSKTVFLDFDVKLKLLSQICLVTILDTQRK